MRKAILVTLLASTLGLGAAAAQADNHNSEKKGHGNAKHEGGKHHGMKGGKRGGHMMKRMAQKLSLTEDQQAQIKTLRENQKELSQALRAEKKALYTEIKALDTTSADYDSEVAVLADKKAIVDRKEFIQRSTARQQFESVLTAEQRVTMKEMKESRKDRSGKGKRGGKRGGKHAGKHSGKRGGKGGMMKGGMADKLNLTDAQKDQITALRAAKKNSDVKTTREESRAQFEAILTAEQLVTLNEMKENFKKRGGKHGGKHGHKHNAK